MCRRWDAAVALADQWSRTLFPGLFVAVLGVDFFCSFSFWLLEDRVSGWGNVHRSRFNCRLADSPYQNDEYTNRKEEIK